MSHRWTDRRSSSRMARVLPSGAKAREHDPQAPESLTCRREAMSQRPDAVVTRLWPGSCRPARRRATGSRPCARQRLPAAVAAEPPEVAPFEAAQVLLAGLGPLPLQQAPGAAGVARLPGLLGQAHFRGVEQATGPVASASRVCLVHGDLSLLRLRQLGGPGDALLPFRLPPFPGDTGEAGQEDQRQRRRQASHHGVPAAPAPAIAPAWLARRAWIGSSSRKRCRSPASSAAVG